jgi:hypothetical protein
VIELPVDRGIYAVDHANRTYRYARRDLYPDRLDPAVNEENKRSLDGYARIFPDGRTGSSPTDRHIPGASRPPGSLSVAAGLPVAALRLAVRAFVDEVEGLPDAPASGAA